MITITLTWHLILVVIISIILIIGMFKEDEGYLDLTGAVSFLLLIILWLIYGGIVIW